MAASAWCAFSTPEASLLRCARVSERIQLRSQSARMVNYAVRRFQNRIITEIMRSEGPGGLPDNLAEAYPAALPGFKPRLSPQWYWFDRQALARMRAAPGSSVGA